MRENKRQQPEVRPYATETQIREMQEKAAGHGAKAAQHEANAVEITRAAENKTSEEVGAAQANAAHYVEQAERTAAEMVRKAREQADADVQQALRKAAADMSEAEGQAAIARSARDAEVKNERYWALTAADEASRAGLQQSVTETVTDLPEQDGARP